MALLTLLGVGLATALVHLTQQEQSKAQ